MEIAGRYSNAAEALVCSAKPCARFLKAVLSRGRVVFERVNGGIELVVARELVVVELWMCVRFRNPVRWCDVRW